MTHLQNSQGCPDYEPVIDAEDPAKFPREVARKVTHTPHEGRETT